MTLAMSNCGYDPMICKKDFLIPVIHYLIEKKEREKFILTRSLARKLRREGVDLLGGRTLNKTLSF